MGVADSSPARTMPRWEPPLTLEVADGSRLGQASHLVARVPSLSFLAVAGSILALVLTLFSSFEQASPAEHGILWLHFAARLLVDYASLVAVMLVVAAARWMVPTHLFLEPPAARAIALSLGSYSLAGMVGGAARYYLRVWLALDWQVEFPWELLANVGAGALAFTMVGFLASQYYPFKVRLDQLRALTTMSEQAATIAARRDFSRRLQLAHRQDEIGHLAQTVNHLLATVETTIQSHHDFLADTSHEMRNPLLAIRVNLELLNRVDDPESREECVRESLQQVDRVSCLVSDLLILARLEAGQIVERRPVALRPLLEMVLREAHMQANGRQIRIDRGDREVVVLGDEGRLTQIVTNLVDNALRHTPSGGLITLSLGTQDRWVHLQVSDTGEGIPAEHLPHIFERFYRVGRDSSSGTGLGLAIAKHLCEAHGGRISAESEPGRGSRFTVSLPVLSDSRPN